MWEENGPSENYSLLFPLRYILNMITILKDAVSIQFSYTLLI
jgi:hypothetical protein